MREAMRTSDDVPTTRARRAAPRGGINKGILAAEHCVCVINGLGCTTKTGCGELSREGREPVTVMQCNDRYP